jgi:putative transposase
MRTNRPEHLATFDYLGRYQYFLTFCTFQRRRAFVAPERVDVVLAQIQRTCQETRFALLAYCFMPDHLHLLVDGQAENADCRLFVARAKQYSGFYYSKAFGERLWQRFGYERTLRSDEATLSVARYILENPLRAGLVRNVREYPYLGSETYTVDQILEAIQLKEGWRRAG